MTFNEWYKWYNPNMDPALDDCIEELQSAYDAGFKEACHRYNLREDPEDYSVSQGFDEYGHYGENNPPLGDTK